MAAASIITTITTGNDHGGHPGAVCFPMYAAINPVTKISTCLVFRCALRVSAGQDCLNGYGYDWHDMIQFCSLNLISALFTPLTSAA